MICSLGTHAGVFRRRLVIMLAIVGLAGGCMTVKKEVNDPPPPPPAPEIDTAAEAAAADARTQKLRALESYAKRVRFANRNELAQEWALTAKDPRSPKHALLMLHPNSPQPDEDQAFDIVESLDSAERRIVLRAYAGFVADQRRFEERLRDNLNAQLERSRKDLRDENKRVESAHARVEQEKQRADALAERVDELQRTLARLREIDKRLIDRTAPNAGK